MKRSIITSIILCLLFSGIAAQNVPKQWTLEECIRYAIANNINLKQSEQNEESRRIELNTAKNSWLPNLSVSSGQSFGFGRSQSREGTLVDRNSAGTSLTIQTNMPLFDGFRIPNNIAAGKLNLKAATEALNRAKEDLAVWVATYYLQALYSKEVFKIAEMQVNLTKEQVANTEVMVEVGKVAVSQLFDIKAQLATDEVQLVDAGNRVSLAMLELIQILELERLGDDFDIVQPEIDDAIEKYMHRILLPDLIYDSAVLFKPRIKEQEYLLERQKKLLRAARSYYYPQLNLSASYSNGYYQSFGNESIVNTPFSEQFKQNAQKNISVNLSIPIFNRFSNRNTVRQAKVNVINQQLMMEDSKKTLYKEIQQAYFNATAEQEKYIASEKSVAASKEALAYAEERYIAGKSTVFEYNESKTKYASSLSQQAQAKYNFIFRAKILDFYNGVEIKL